MGKQKPDGIQHLFLSCAICLLAVFLYNIYQLYNGIY